MMNDNPYSRANFAQETGYPMRGPTPGDKPQQFATDLPLGPAGPALYEDKYKRKFGQNQQNMEALARMFGAPQQQKPMFPVGYGQ